MVLENLGDYIQKKWQEYTQEADHAQKHQESAKSFAQTYKSEAYKTKLRLEELEAGITSLASGGSSGGTGNPGSFSGTIQQKFWQFFLADGYSKEAVAGMMGNVQHESGFESDKIEQTPGVTYGEGYGLIQWSYGRKERLIEEAEKQGKKVNDIQFQLEFLKMELDEGWNWLSDTYPFSKFKGTTDIEWAVNAFCWAFERPHEDYANLASRIKYAHQYYEELKDFKGSPGVSGDFHLPAEADNLLTSGYGMRLHPTRNEMHMHAALDIAGGGLSLTSIADGHVTIASDPGGGYGNLVKIDHGGGLVSLYAHLRDFAVSGGDKVKKGQRIGTMGTTGLSTGVHLHFEMLQDGTPLNPETYFPNYRRTELAERERKEGLDSVV